MPRRLHDEYAYNTIREVVESASNGQVLHKHFYGIVIENSVPRQTQGSDYVVNLRVADRSTVDVPGLRNGVEVVCFGSPDKLPVIANVGDIIRFHRVKVQIFRNQPQLVARLKLLETAYCLFHRDLPPGPPSASDDEPYKRSSDGYTWNDEVDPRLLSSYRRHSTSMLRTKNVVPEGLCEYLHTIGELTPESKNFDLIVKVMHATPASGQDFAVVYVWDGTDVRPVSVALDTVAAATGALGSPSKPPPPGAAPPGGAARLAKRRDFPLLDALAERAARAAGGAAAVGGSQSQSQSQSNSPLRDIPPIGSIIPVVLYPVQFTDTLPVAGEWVKLRNMRIVACCGQLQVLCVSNSKWAKAEASSPLVGARLASFRARREGSGTDRASYHNVQSWWGPRSPMLTEIKSQGWDLPTVEATMAADPFSAKKFLCVVRLVGHESTDVGLFCQLRSWVEGNQQLQRAALADFPDSSADPSRWCFNVRLRVEDATGALEPLLSDEDAVAFLGVRAGNLADMQSTRQGILDKMTALLSLQLRPHGMWLPVVLAAYAKSAPDGSGLVESVAYRIVDTALRDPPGGWAALAAGTAGASGSGSWGEGSGVVGAGGAGPAAGGAAGAAAAAAGQSSAAGAAQ